MARARRGRGSDEILQARASALRVSRAGFPAHPHVLVGVGENEILGLLDGKQDHRPPWRMETPSRCHGGLFCVDLACSRTYVKLWTMLDMEC